MAWAMATLGPLSATPQLCVPWQDIHTKEKINASLVNSYEDCAEELNMTWHNSKVNFDNVLAAYLALFQVVSRCCTAFLMG